MADDQPPIVPPPPGPLPTAMPPSGPLPPAMPPLTAPAPPAWGAMTPSASPEDRPSDGPRAWRRRPVVIGMAVVVAAAAAAIAVWLGTGSGSSGQAGSASAVEHGAMAAAKAAGSFHYVSTSNVGGQVQLTVGDAAANSGRQVITLSGHRFTVLVVGSTTFFQGDAVSMIQNLQVPANIAAAHANQWISLQPGDAPYQSVYAAVTTSSALDDNITFTPTSTTAATTVAGQRVIGVRGAIHGLQGQQAHGTGTLYVSDRGKHLPVRYVESGKVGSGNNVQSYSFRIDFSAWGEPVNVVAPPNGVPFSSFGLGSGNGPTPGPTVLA